MVGPDPVELNAANSVLVAGNLQSRAQGFAVSKVKLVPFGLPPAVHAQCGCAVPNPLEAEVQLADDLEFACRVQQVLGEEFGRWQKRQWRILMAHCCALRELEEFCQSQRTLAARATSLCLAPGAVDASARSIACLDQGLGWLGTVGFGIVRDIPSTGVFRGPKVPAPP